jgi:small subunit ribosomal protein S17
MKKIGVILDKPKFNTATVFLKELRKKPKQKINYLKIKKLLVETNNFPVEIGDIVEIQQTRPLSKMKNYIIIRILLK